MKIDKRSWQIFAKIHESIRSPVPEIIDPVFAKTSQNARFLLSENERFGLVFVKTGSINSATRSFRENLSPVLTPVMKPCL